MIILEENKKFTADVPFSSVVFNPSELPFYALNLRTPQKVFHPQIGLNLPYWYTSRLTNTFAFKIAKSLIPVGGLVTIDVLDTYGEVYYSTDALTLWEDSVWRICNVMNCPTPVKGCFTLVLNVVADPFSEPVKTQIAYVNMEAVQPSAFNQYTFFNYMDSGDALGFPFSNLSTDHKQNGLSFHVRGGVQIGGTKHVIDQEFFRDQRYVPHTLSPDTRKTAVLTIGGSEGVPEYVGDTLNAIFCCDTIFMNGRRIARLGDSVPEATPIAKGYPYVNFSVEIEYIETNPNVFDVYTNQL
jgi:hypothetical protein